MSDVATGSHQHSVTITGGQSATGSFTLPTDPLSVEITIPPHRHPVQIPAKTIRIGGPQPPNGSGIIWSPAPSVMIPGSVDIQPTGEMDLLVWRDGNFRGRFDVGTKVPFDPDIPLVEKTIGVMEADDIATYLDLSIETNTQLIPPLL